MDWKNKDGDKYIARNHIDYRKRRPLLNKILPKDISSVHELGCNCGHNLMAIKDIAEWDRKKEITVSGIEINGKAVRECKAKNINIIQGSIIDEIIFVFDTVDLVLTWGLLIHINPIDLGGVFNSMSNSASKYILMIEHKEPCIRTISDRWYKDGGSMWVMDFGKEFIKRHPEWKIKKQGWASGKKPKKIDYTAPVGESHIHPNDYYWLLQRK
jgi:hypothetical protein